MATATAMATATGKRKMPEAQVSRKWQDRFFGLPVLIIASLALSYLAFIQSAEAIFPSRNPALAERISGSPDAAINLWMIEGLKDPARFADPSIQADARKALLASPLNAAALRSLAYFENAQGNTNDSIDLAKLSLQVTRRDELAQLFLTQRYAEANRLSDAVDHLSVALTTLRRGRSDLFGLMAPLLARDDFIAQLTPLVQPDNPWMMSFLDYTMRSGGNGAQSAARLMLAARPSAGQTFVDGVGPTTLSLLVDQGQIALAERMYDRLLDGGADISRDPALNEMTTREKFGFFAWTALDLGNSGAEVGKVGNGDTVGALIYAAPGERRKVVLTRVMRLGPGSYSVADDREVVAGDDNLSLDWEVSCFSQNAWRSVMRQNPNSRVFVVPESCALQKFDLLITTGRRGSDAEVLLTDVSIRPA